MTETAAGLVLTLGNPGYRDTVLQLPEVRCHPRTEHHVTLVGRRLFNRLTADQQQQLREHAGQLDWSVRTTGRCLLLRRNHASAPPRHCLVELCAVPLVVTLYQQLSRLLDCPCPVPPMHITAMSDDGEPGIGLYRPADLDRYQQRWLSAKETDALLVRGRMRVMMLPTPTVGA